VAIPRQDGSRVHTPKWEPPISGVSDLPFSDRPSGPIHTTNCRRTESAGTQMAGEDQSPPVQGFLSVSSSDYGSPTHLVPYSPSVVVTKQGGGALSFTSGHEAVYSPVGGQGQATSYSGPGPPYSTGPSHPTPRSTFYNRGRHTGHNSLPAGSISHHHYYLHPCGRNANYSSHITNRTPTTQHGESL